MCVHVCKCVWEGEREGWMGRRGERETLDNIYFWNYYLGLGKDCLDMTPKSLTTKENIDKLDLIKTDT